MKRLFILFAFALLASPLVGPGSAQQVPGNSGFDRLLCMADGVLDITELGEDADGNRVAEVTIPHGKSGTSSTHTIVYEDTNGNEVLDCDDKIISVT